MRQLTGWTQDVLRADYHTEQQKLGFWEQPTPPPPGSPHGGSRADRTEWPEEGPPEETARGFPAGGPGESRAEARPLKGGRGGTGEAEETIYRTWSVRTTQGGRRVFTEWLYSEHTGWGWGGSPRLAQGALVGYVIAGPTPSLLARADPSGLAMTTQKPGNWAEQRNRVHVSKEHSTDDTAVVAC